jgi:hypothetical protein
METLRKDCLSCTWPTHGLVDDEEVAQVQLDFGLCGWCAGNRVRWRNQRAANLAAKQARKQAAATKPGRLGWWPFSRKVH